MLAGNLFHFKKDQPEYSIKPEDHGSKPLISPTKTSRTLLNEFFFYVLSKVSSWQSMAELRVTTQDDVEELCVRSFYCELPQTKSGNEMPKVPVVSRYLVAYLASFVAVAPFFRSKDDRVAFGTEKAFRMALKNLRDIDDTALSAYLSRKMAAWYRRFPPLHSPDRAETPKRANGADGGEEEKTSEDEDDDAERLEASESSGDDAQGGAQQ